MAKAVALTPATAARVKETVKKANAPGRGKGEPTGRIPRDELEGFWAAIGAGTVTGGRYRYAWTQQRGTVDAWEDLPGGLAGTTTERYAIDGDEEVTPRPDPLEAGRIVWMRRDWVWDDAEEEWVRGYRFTGGGAGSSGGFWGQFETPTLITGNEARWNYPFFQVKQMLAGEVAALEDGITGTATNQVEANNAATGIGTMGSGDVISSGDFASGLKLKPIPAGCVRWIRPGTDCDGDPVWLFEANNKKTECAE